MPVFSDEVSGNYSSELQEICSGNAACLFDAQQSGNPALGQSSMQAEMQVNMDSQALSK